MACLFQYDTGLLYYKLSDGSRADGLLAAVEYLSVLLVFQFLYHGTQGGLSYTAVFRGFSEMAELINGKHVFQLL